MGTQPWQRNVGVWLKPRSKAPPAEDCRQWCRTMHVVDGSQGKAGRARTYKNTLISAPHIPCTGSGSEAVHEGAVRCKGQCEMDESEPWSAFMDTHVSSVLKGIGPYCKHACSESFFSKSVCRRASSSTLSGASASLEVKAQHDPFQQELQVSRSHCRVDEPSDPPRCPPNVSAFDYSVSYTASGAPAQKQDAHPTVNVDAKAPLFPRPGACGDISRFTGGRSPLQSIRSGAAEYNHSWDYSGNRTSGSMLASNYAVTEDVYKEPNASCPERHLATPNHHVTSKFAGWAQGTAGLAMVEDQSKGASSSAVPDGMLDMTAAPVAAFLHGERCPSFATCRPPANIRMAGRGEKQCNNKPADHRAQPSFADWDDYLHPEPAVAVNAEPGVVDIVTPLLAERLHSDSAARLRVRNLLCRQGTSSEPPPGHPCPAAPVKPNAAHSRGLHGFSALGDSCSVDCQLWLAPEPWPPTATRSRCTTQDGVARGTTQGGGARGTTQGGGARGTAQEGESTGTAQEGTSACDRTGIADQPRTTGQGLDMAVRNIDSRSAPHNPQMHHKRDAAASKHGTAHKPIMAPPTGLKACKGRHQSMTCQGKHAAAAYGVSALEFAPSEGNEQGDCVMAPPKEHLGTAPHSETAAGISVGHARQCPTKRSRQTPQVNEGIKRSQMQDASTMHLDGIAQPGAGPAKPCINMPKESRLRQATLRDCRSAGRGTAAPDTEQTCSIDEPGEAERRGSGAEKLLRSGMGARLKKRSGLGTVEQGIGQLSERLVIDGQQCKDASDATVLQDLRARLQRNCTPAVAIVYRHSLAHAVQYSCSSQPLERGQLACLRKARTSAKRAAPGGGNAGANAAAEGGRSSGRCSGGSTAQKGAAEAPATPIGLAILCIPADENSQGADGLPARGTALRFIANVGEVADTSPLFFMPVLDPLRGSCSSAGPSWPCVTTDGCVSRLPRLAPVHAELAASMMNGGNGRNAAVCTDAKSVLRDLERLGVRLSGSHTLALVDPLLLGWLHEPHLMQRDEKELELYSLDTLATRQGLLPARDTLCSAAPATAGEVGQGHVGAASGAAAGSGARAGAGGALAARLRTGDPLQRCAASLVLSVLLVQRLTALVAPRVPQETLRMEVQVQAILAKMEVLGVPFDALALTRHRDRISARLAEISITAAGLVGHSFNISSASQLSQVLYGDLRLPVPQPGGGRGAARSHTPTDEASLRQLSALHPLPGLVLEHRCLSNIVNKWCEAPWVAHVAAKVQRYGVDAARVHCTWNQMATATGRLSSCSPNLQAVTKYEVATSACVSASQAASQASHVINVRDAFAAPAGRVLLAADYSQVELRLLAHLSGEVSLTQMLCRAGAGGDVFKLMAASWLRPGADPGTISNEDRERAKRVTYGLIYGLTPFGLAAQLRQQGVDVAAAQRLIDSFLTAFPGVRRFMAESVEVVRREGAVMTLLGRHRPISGITSKDANARREAARKAVNTRVQGSAADLIKVAMCKWDDFASQHLAGGLPVARLVGQIHDELLFEVDDVGVPGALTAIARQVAVIMQSAMTLQVPLRANVSSGATWGSMQRMPLDLC